MFRPSAPAFAVVGLLCLTSLSSFSHAQDLGGDEGRDWQAVQAVEAKLRDEKVTDPKAQIAAWQQLLKTRPNITAIQGCTVRRNIAGLQRWAIKDLAAVKATTDEALAAYPDHPATVLVLEEQAKALNDAGKAAEVEALVKPHLPLVFAAGQQGHPYLRLCASMSLHHLDDALHHVPEGGDASTRLEARLKERIALLQRALWEVPSYLDDTQQGAGGWENGWMFERVIDALIRDERAPEALRYARLYYSTCDFDKNSVERTTKALGRAWAANDEFVALRAFNAAQEVKAETAKTETPKNPLLDVKLPVVPKTSTAVVSKRATELQKKLSQRALDESGVKEAVGLFLAQGDYKAAMDAAKSLLREQIDNPAGAKQVCRVLKAYDASTRRSNQFLSYLNGNAKNPMTAFYAELEAGDTSSTAGGAQ